MTGKVLVAAALLSLSMTGCGGSEADDSSASPSSSPSPSGSASSSAAPPSVSVPGDVALKDACPQVEYVLPDGIILTAGRFNQLADDLARIYDTADVEARNALQLLVPAIERISRLGSNPKPDAYLRANQAYLAALDTFAGRCKAVGSSALQ